MQLGGWSKMVEKTERIAGEDVSIIPDGGTCTEMHGLASDPARMAVIEAMATHCEDPQPVT
jgi:hypothetical protein